MRSKIIFFVFLLVLLSLIGTIKIAEAKIVFAKPFKTYNLGDKIEQQVIVVVNQDFEGFLKIALQCKHDADTVETLIYFSPLQLKANSEKKFDLVFSYNSTGLCRFLALLENGITESASSEEFLITNDIVLELELNKQYFMPSDNLEIKGKIQKKSGEPFTGKADLRIFDKNFSVSVVKGSFSFSVKVPENAKPRDNTCFVNAADDLGNNGSAILEFKVISVASSLVIEVNNETILPGEVLQVTPKLIDQYNLTIPENVSLRLFREKGFLFFREKTLLLEELLVSGNSTSFRFNNFAEPGDYFLEAYSQGFKKSKIIYVPRVEKIDINLTNGTLIVRNIGNVPYKKPLQFELTLENFSRTLILDLSLDVNETQIFKLEAPKGTYEVTFKLTEGEKKFYEVPLLGEVVATVELSKERNKKINYFWIVLLIVILFLAYLFRKRLIFLFKTKKKPKYARFADTFEEKKDVIEKQAPQPVQLFFSKPSTSLTEDPIKKIFLKNASTLQACYLEEAKLLGVQKKQVSVVCCNFRNLKELENLKKKNTIQFERITNNLFQGIVNIIKAYNGVADLHSNNLMILFLQEDQELYAVKTANEIKAFISKFNEELKKEELEFMFGASFGVHSGLLAFVLTDKTVRYTESDTTKIAKALSNKALKNEVLISNAIYPKVVSLIKVKRITPLYLDDKRAIECFLLQHPAPSEIKEQDKNRVRKFLESLQ